MIESVKVTAHITGGADNKLIEVSQMVSPVDAASGFGKSGESILELLLAGQSVKAARCVAGLKLLFLMEPVVPPVEL